MRGDYGDDASGSEEEAFSACLLESIRHFVLDFGFISINERILPDPTADGAIEKLLGFSQGRERFSIMPVHNGEIQRIDKRKVNVMPMQMEQVTP